MISGSLTVEKMRRWDQVGEVCFQRHRGIPGEAGAEGGRQGFLGDEVGPAGS